MTGRRKLDNSTDDSPLAVKKPKGVEDEEAAPEAAKEPASPPAEKQQEETNNSRAFKIIVLSDETKRLNAECELMKGGSKFVSVFLFKAV